ncbi:LysR substrate-binding domain-containing protein [Caballeronia sp. LZ035]|uniref:LysR substrate-binding domain-containing protein n=1 Tax=Caballeronia sp. LZ035 TaxID=3038568 RepID=UPI00285EB91F|nr:LysR substrate-binding domain-containing protein [Caballeronia sp. LZ035]MDR5759084.1 LysR substrate-binding domain-containing protein [Caballeronia sp. LZ035]
MGWKLPPLNALKAFEAAARLESFTLASEELNVTPGAISRQIKTLESSLGQVLFERNNREVKLTPESRDFAAAVGEAFRAIDIAAGSFIKSRSEEPLRVACSMIVATRWLFPRLGRFHALHPHRHVSLTTNLPPLHAPFAGSTIEALMKLGTESTWASDIVAERLFGSELVAICSPALLRGKAPLRAPEDLFDHTILSTAMRPLSWSQWMESAGISPAACRHPIVELESSTLTYMAALAGQGVALGERQLIVDDVREGRLVVPFDIVHKSPESFFLIYKRELQNTSRLREFSRWVIEEARGSEIETDNTPGIPARQAA